MGSSTISACRVRGMLPMTGSEPKPKLGILQSEALDTSSNRYVQREDGQGGNAISS